MKTTFKLGFLAVLLGSITAVGVASASPQAGRGDRPDVKAFDTNKDGKLDDAERAAFKAAREANRGARKAQMLATFDTNKDGKLDDTEREAMMTARMTEHFKKLDTDGNGQISFAEFKAGKPKGGMGHHGRHGKGRHGGGDHQRGPGHDRGSMDDGPDGE
ncbi:MAG: EF-hand domain-containing protein [Deltaproteobacteria bacterium]|nr:EF-hand domain-containing protein [Deltaproteobacteria bacterium]